MNDHHQHPAHVHPPCPHCQGQHVPPRPREQVFVSDPDRVVKSCHDVVTAAGQVIVKIIYRED